MSAVDEMTWGLGESQGVLGVALNTEHRADETSVVRFECRLCPYRRCMLVHEDGKDFAICGLYAPGYCPCGLSEARGRGLRRRLKHPDMLRKPPVPRA